VSLSRRQCSAIKPNGERCTLLATGQHGLCWAHAPENAEKRRRTAARGGRGKANREVARLEDELRALKDDVLGGSVDRNDAAVVVQVYRVLKDLIELERRVRETDELAAEIEELKREYGAAG
jgi:hypothetical protein